jgi:hypothetical protein
MSQVQAMREKLESFYREQLRQKFRIKDGKRNRMVQELSNGGWHTLVTVDMDCVVEISLGDDLLTGALDRIIDYHVGIEMAKLEVKAHGGGDGRAVPGEPRTPAGAGEGASPADAREDEPFGGILREAS